MKAGLRAPDGQRATGAGHGERTRIAAAAAAALRAAIRLAGGREVCFVGSVDDSGVVQTVRVVARGGVAQVLALPGFARRGEMLIHNHPSGMLEPSDADMQIAARMHDDGIGFGIVDNEASRMYVVVEVPRANKRTPLEHADVDAILGPDGAVARTHGAYEDRESQREMAGAIAKLYSIGGIGLLEAGTGVGKSLAYLVPALRWAALNDERTVVATATIPLQEQLVAKDLPFLERALSEQKVRFALLKGWRNYLCLQRLEQVRDSAAMLLEPELAGELEGISRWASATSDGTLADLPTAPRGELWDEVAAEGDLCTRLRCKHFTDCFVFKARRRAAEADVVVVNHHLLMADVAVRRASQNWNEAAVLPAYGRLIIDEGHHLEDAAAQHLGATATRRGLQRLAARLERKGKGLLPSLIARLAGRRDLLSVASLDLVRDRLAPAVYSVRDHGNRVFDLLDAWLSTTNENVVRLTDAFDDADVWRFGLREALENLLSELSMLGDGLTTVRERLETDPKREEEFGPILNEIKAVCRRLEAAGDALRSGLDSDSRGPALIRWIEARGEARTDRLEQGRNVAVTSVPLDLAPVLRDDLFRKVETTVVTSATLAIGETFGFVRTRLGLDEDDVEPVAAAYRSPFDFQTQAVLAIPDDAPAPNAPARAHVQAVVDYAADLAHASDGGIFVLCTSHRDVREAAVLLRSRKVDARWPLLVHGEEQRERLLDRFRASGRAILLGTTTFWEGVDVPGDALRGLILSKLPFRVPTEPLTAAHCEAITQRGGDAFREYMVPHAALRLKQGFGRLIRTRTDRGAIVLADSRILNKSYGATLLDALPPARRLTGPWSEIYGDLRGFYASGQRSNR
ncbi:MAG TPA: helicase C-terminal domain-containing protein [Gemmatimonadaceae bacterium]|nr:helicase C-terminal domain-containing protein [Gemmatimonadaceae bacterium]